MRRNELPDFCLSTLPSTGQLIVLKRGERGYYASDWDTGKREENQNIVLCLDNDEPGRKAAAVLKELLRGYEVIDRPPVRGKDYNDLLRYRRDAQRGEAR